MSRPQLEALAGAWETRGQHKGARLLWGGGGGGQEIITVIPHYSSYMRPVVSEQVAQPEVVSEVRDA